MDTNGPGRSFGGGKERMKSKHIIKSTSSEVLFIVIAIYEDQR